MRLPSVFNNKSLSNPTSVFDLMNRFDELFYDFDKQNKWLAKGDFVPQVDIEEKDGVWHLTADIPGVKKEDLKVEFSDGYLTISGEKVHEAKGEGRYFERSYGKFTRSFTLPKTINGDKIEARFENGVLHLTAPTIEGKKTTNITIS